MLNLFDLTDRVSLITGGTGVLGVVFAKALAEYGSDIILADLDQDRCDQCAEEIAKSSGRRALGLKVDVAEADDVDSAVRRATQEFGRIDILINNAAAQPAGMFTSFERFPIEVWNRVMAVNLTGQFLMCRAVGPVMLEQMRGSVINISSIYGVVGPNWHLYDGSDFNTPAAYSASKAGVLGLTRYLATYWAEKGIRVNSITPGGIYRGHKDPFLQNYRNRVPMARMADQDELRGAIIYLASDASSYVTGHNLVVDGGWTAW